MLLPGDRLEVRLGDHAPVADEDQPAEREPLAQIPDDLLDCGMVDAVAGPDVMGDRPAGDHHHADDHLDVVRLAVAAVAVLGEVGRPGPLEVGAGDVVEDQVGLEAEEVAEAVIQRHLDSVLGPEELVEGAVPGVELAGMDADAAAAVPMGEEAAALAVADEVGLEPAGQAMLTGRGDEPVGDQREGAVGEGDALGFAEVLVEDVPEAELVEEGADDEDRPPGGGLTDVECGRIAGLFVGIAGEEASELGEDLDEEVLAAEVGDHALLDLDRPRGRLRRCGCTRGWSRWRSGP